MKLLYYYSIEITNHIYIMVKFLQNLYKFDSATMFHVKPHHFCCHG